MSTSCNILLGRIKCRETTLRLASSYFLRFKITILNVAFAMPGNIYLVPRDRQSGSEEREMYTIPEVGHLLPSSPWQKMIDDINSMLCVVQSIERAWDDEIQVHKITISVRAPATFGQNRAISEAIMRQQIR